MCLLVFSWQPASAQPLLLLANRDEFLQRPTAPLAHWEDHPQVLAGRDLEAQGTWLGVNSRGAFATLTNIRDAALPEGRISRGQLVSNFLTGEQSPAEYLQQLQTQLAAYSGFNLLLGNREQLWFLNSVQAQPQQLAAGVYALCNASLDTPWPKLQRLHEQFSAIYQTASDQQLLALMQDQQRAADNQLPETGVGLTAERLLSSIFIKGTTYGTRATSLLRLQAQQLEFYEQSYGLQGHKQQLEHFQLAW